jgi:hypothetical protein
VPSISCPQCNLPLVEDEVRALTCAWCGANLPEVTPEAAPVVKEPTPVEERSSSVVRWLGVLAVVFLLAGAVWVLFLAPSTDHPGKRVASAANNISVQNPQPEAEPTEPGTKPEAVSEREKPVEPITEHRMPPAERKESDPRNQPGKAVGPVRAPKGVALAKPPIPKETVAGQSAPEGGTLRVQYRCVTRNLAGNQMAMSVRIVNTGKEAVPLEELTLRYWYTDEGNKPETCWCDWAAVGAANVKTSFHALARPAPLADHYLEVGFTAAAKTVKHASHSGEIQLRISKQDWSAYDQTNDWSFDAAKTAMTDWPRITLYRKGVLVWGQEPPQPAPGR